MKLITMIADEIVNGIKVERKAFSDGNVIPIVTMLKRDGAHIYVPVTLSASSREKWDNGEDVTILYGEYIQYDDKKFYIAETSAIAYSGRGAIVYVKDISLATDHTLKIKANNGSVEFRDERVASHRWLESEDYSLEPTVAKVHFAVTAVDYAKKGFSSWAVRTHSLLIETIGNENVTISGYVATKKLIDQVKNDKDASHISDDMYYRSVAIVI